ncbi:hypothetical protein ACH4PU_31335 [Streptomyces sp. NPDC021100]|uniref:hypothetical protein n=1 Tax=Streptomyces sp. NPDC021100 TaxID=3365114 RepID=UPI00379A51C6
MTHKHLQVDAAYYGRGVLFPVVIIDHNPVWNRALPGALPHQGPGGEELLAVRWCGTHDDEPAAPALLLDAARHAPAVPASNAELASYRDALPEQAFLITLPVTAVISTWAERPGRPRAATCAIWPAAA